MKLQNGERRITGSNAQDIVSHQSISRLQ